MTGLGLGLGLELGLGLGSDLRVRESRVSRVRVSIRATFRVSVSSPCR